MRYAKLCEKIENILLILKLTEPKPTDSIEKSHIIFKIYKTSPVRCYGISFSVPFVWANRQPSYCSETPWVARNPTKVTPALSSSQILLWDSDPSELSNFCRMPRNRWLPLPGNSPSGARWADLLFGKIFAGGIFCNSDYLALDGKLPKILKRELRIMWSIMHENMPS